jgi:hypothetical protein
VSAAPAQLQAGVQRVVNADEVLAFLKRDESIVARAKLAVLDSSLVQAQADVQLQAARL